MHLYNHQHQGSGGGGGDDGGDDVGDDDDGVVQVYYSFQDLNDAVKALEVETVTCYNIKNSSKGFDSNTDLRMFLSTINSEKDIKLLWQNMGKSDNTAIQYNGTPFVILNKRWYTCHQGKDRNKETNDKKKEKKQQVVAKLGLSVHYVLKSRNHKQPSKKLNCPAQFTAKKLLYFRQFEIKGKGSRYQKDQTNKNLKSASWKCKTSMSGTDSTTVDDGIDLVIPQKKRKVEFQQEINVKLIFVTKFPRLTHHKFHRLGQAARVIEMYP